MKHWEYITRNWIDLHGGGMDHLGAEGWELISVIGEPLSSDSVDRFYFKRELAGPTPTLVAWETNSACEWESVKRLAAEGWEPIGVTTHIWHDRDGATHQEETWHFRRKL